MTAGGRNARHGATVLVLWIILVVAGVVMYLFTVWLPTWIATIAGATVLTLAVTAALPIARHSVRASPALVMGLARCGHRHDLWEARAGYRSVRPAIWRVVAPVAGPPPQNEHLRPPVALTPGTLLRHDQSDSTAQEDDSYLLRHFMMERFAVIDGPHAGQCVEFQAMDLEEGESAIPAEIQPA